MLRHKHPFATPNPALCDFWCKCRNFFVGHQVGSRAIQHLVEGNHEDGVPQKSKGNKAIIELQAFEPDTMDLANAV